MPYKNQSEIRDKLREEFEKHFESQGYGGEYSGNIDAPYSFISDWWLYKCELIRQNDLESIREWDIEMRKNMYRNDDYKKEWKNGYDDAMIDLLAHLDSLKDNK